MKINVTKQNNVSLVGMPMDQYLVLSDVIKTVHKSMEWDSSTRCYNVGERLVLTLDANEMKALVRLNNSF